MPYDPHGLVALSQGGDFTLWHYRTTDLRAAVQAPGYFGPAAPLAPGDLVLVQAADAMALLPARAAAGVGAGLTLDAVASTLRLAAGAHQPFTVTQTVAALARMIVLAPLLAGIVTGGTVGVSASVTGPTTTVAFSLSDAAGSVLPPGVQLAPVSGGTASASFPAPPAGTGYRIHVAATDAPDLTATSPAFAVLPVTRLLTETGGHLLAESGGTLRA